MPNPGAMTSLQAFDKESISTVIQVPDYQLRLRLSLQQREPLVVEAFLAFGEMFYLHLRWKVGGTCPELLLTSVGSRDHKLMLDLCIQSPQFKAHPGGEGLQPVLCTWSTPMRPMEVQRPSSVLPLQSDRQATFGNDVNIPLDQVVTFTLTGTIWELDDTPIHSLHCKSYRSSARDCDPLGQPDIAARMIANVAATWGSAEVAPDIQLVPDADPAADEDDGTGSCHEPPAFSGGGASAPSTPRKPRRGAPRGAHAFMLQAQSPVFRRMLAAPMTEAADRVVHMAGVSPTELDDLLSAIYSFGVPAEVREEDDRLIALLGLADRYELLSLRDECATLLEPRVTEANMGALLKVADMHHAATLRATVLGFVAARLERVAAVMDTDDRMVRRSLRDYIVASESCHRKHAAAADMKAMEVTLTV